MVENKNEFDVQNAELSNNEVDTASDYIAAIKTMKETTVSKDKYNEAIEENRKLIKALTNGETLSVEVKPEVDVAQIRKELFNVDGNLSNLQYVEKALELRDALIEKGEPDPFLPVSSRMSPTAEEIQVAEKAAEIYRECLEYADGNSEVFTNELMRRTAEIGPVRRTRR